MSESYRGSVVKLQRQRRITTNYHQKSCKPSARQISKKICTGNVNTQKKKEILGEMLLFNIFFFVFVSQVVLLSFQLQLIEFLKL